ncbi:MAG: divergent polysaccharide deacetylase family protein [Candidatus Omnitrophica bacterium]|nr:divergent polysaccharide deacetylase family protein [Candidatus Omnitrophota bacterium]
MVSQGKNKSLSPVAIVLWVVVAVVCIQGFFFFQKRLAPGETKKSQQTTPVKPVKKAPKTAPEKPVVYKKGAAPLGRIAIVIDDWGYNNSHCKYLDQMTEPAGIAILPGLPYSRDIIQCAAEKGKQPMLHLPLEPHSLKEIYTKGYVLTTQMGAAELKSITVKIMDEMKGVVGVNNHTGSKGSESELVMTTVLSETRKRGLFFVDSVTSDRTVGGQVAAKLKMHIAKRDVFLDNKNERAAIEHQFAEVAQIARINGFALAIGHDRALSLQIIIEQMKKLSEQGYEFVTVPDYIKKNEYPRF